MQGLTMAALVTAPVALMLAVLLTLRVPLTEVVRALGGHLMPV